VDGLTSAYVIAEYLNKQVMSWYTKALSYNTDSQVELLEQLDDDEYSLLYIVDFSLPLELIDTIRTNHPDLMIIILDHHKTAFEMYAPGMEVEKESVFTKLEKKLAIHLDNNKSGAGLCWEYCNGKRAEKPELVKYVQDWDLWRFKYGDKTKYVHHFILNSNRTINTMAWLATTLEDPILAESVFDKGKEFYEEHMKKVTSYVEAAEPIIILGVRALAVACDGKFASEVGNELAKKSGTFGATYSLEKGHRIKWSFRGVPGFDVSRLAKRLGGGGHRGAAGVELSIAPRGDS